jgi:hypothetical protein
MARNSLPISCESACRPRGPGPQPEQVRKHIADEVDVLVLGVNWRRVQYPCQCRAPALAWSPGPIFSALVLSTRVPETSR